MTKQRELMAELAGIAQPFLAKMYGEPLDGDNTEEVSIMFQEQLDYINGNLSKKEIKEKNIIT